MIYIFYILYIYLYILLRASASRNRCVDVNWRSAGVHVSVDWARTAELCGMLVGLCQHGGPLLVCLSGDVLGPQYEPGQRQQRLEKHPKCSKPKRLCGAGLLFRYKRSSEGRLLISHHKKNSRYWTRWQTFWNIVIYIYIYMYVYTYIYIYICICTYMYIYTCINNKS